MSSPVRARSAVASAACCGIAERIHSRQIGAGGRGGGPDVLGERVVEPNSDLH
ncbi:MAG: hypothetical protein ACRDTH_01650 [Pseudonocardiaceae bacterium]